MGRGIYIRTEEHRKQMSEAVKHSEKHSLAVSDSDYKERMRVISLARKAKPPVSTGENHWSHGLNTENHPLFKGYKYCSNCGKRLARRTSTKCVRCSKLKKNTPLYRQIRNISEYVKWRCEVFIRDNYSCQECGASNVRIEAHHVKPFVKILRDNGITSIEEAKHCKELWDINNGKTLCKDCHKTKRMKISHHVEKTKNTLLQTFCIESMPHYHSQRDVDPS